MVAPASRADGEARAHIAFPSHSEHPLEALLDARLTGFCDSVSAGLDWLAGRVVLFRHGDLVFVSFGFFGALGALLTLAWMGVILTGQGVSIGAFGAMALAACTLVAAYRQLFEASRKPGWEGNRLAR